MSGHLDVMVGVGLVILTLMLGAWLIAVSRRGTHGIDVTWPTGLLLAAWVARAIGDGAPDRRDLLTAMVTIWAIRRLLHEWWRSRVAPDGGPIVARHVDELRSPVASLALIVGGQGLLVFVVSLPVQLAATPASPEIGWVAVAGVALWGIGLFVETVGDAQLARFRTQPANRGRVLDRGLWRWSRHPNHFGQCCVWWGTFVVAGETADARVALVSPLVMSAVLLRASYDTDHDRRLMTRLSGYADYVARTSAFVPSRRSAPPR